MDKVSIPGVLVAEAARVWVTFGKVPKEATEVWLTHTIFRNEIDSQFIASFSLAPENNGYTPQQSP